MTDPEPTSPSPGDEPRFSLFAKASSRRGKGRKKKGSGRGGGGRGGNRRGKGKGGGGRRRKGKRRGGLLRLLRTLLLLCLVGGAVAALAGAVHYHRKAAAFDLEKLREVPERTLVYDRNGQRMGHVSGHGENRIVVDVDQVSPHFVQAILAREDSRFHSHGGVDYRGVLRAVVENLRRGDMEQGASTLTMQLARNTYGMTEKSLDRKFLEAALARRIERHFSKDEILAAYMNRIYFGAGLYGIERAAEGFFMKTAAGLTLGESAMLAGIIRGPSLLNPFRSLEDAEDTRDEVLARMVDEGTITEAEAEAARGETIALRPPDQRLATGDYVLQQIYDLLDGVLTDVEIEQGGLRIHTTIDAELQAEAQRSLDARLTAIEGRQGWVHPPRSAHSKGSRADTDYVQGAVVSLDNRNGGILALVGGRDFGESPFNRAVASRRQCGSTFKPFLYAVAFDRGGLLPGDYVSDGPLRMRTPGGQVWSPKNSDGSFGGLQPAALGLIRSRNTMSVRVGQFAGLDNVRSLCEALKIGEIPASPVSFLGAFETTPMTLTSAYSTFPSGGENRTPYLIERIEDSGGSLLFQNEIRGHRIFPPSVSAVTSDILGKVMDEGTGTDARKLGYSAHCYGKTGTTNDYRDAWFVGYTDKVTTGVWVGMDRPRTIMNRGYGSTLALPVWTDVMKEAESAGFPAAPLPGPPGAKPVLICRECGELASKKTTRPYQMDLSPDLIPRGSCRGHGGGLFTGNQARQPQAPPVPGLEHESYGRPAGNAQPRAGDPRGKEGGFLRRLGRRLFGGGNR